MIETLALAALAVATGQGLRRWVPLLARYDLPAPVLGGLLVAVIVSLLRRDGQDLVHFDTTLQAPLMIAFFTTIGFGASLRLLRVGGVQVVWFLAIATVAALAQNLLGAGLALAMGLPPLLGVLAGSVTLTGGPATGLAFAPLFEQAGVSGATVVAITAAMAGIVMGGLFGGPVAGRIIARRGLHSAGTRAMSAAAPTSPEHPTDTAAPLLRAVILILLAMWVGGYLAISGRFSTGTLYGALKRLLEQEWIERFDNPEAVESGRPRKEYRLTEAGRRILSAEAARLESLVAASRLRLRGSEG